MTTLLFFNNQRRKANTYVGRVHADWGSGLSMVLGTGHIEDAEQGAESSRRGYHVNVYD